VATSSAIVNARGNGSRGLWNGGGSVHHADPHAPPDQQDPYVIGISASRGFSADPSRSDPPPRMLPTEVTCDSHLRFRRCLAWLL
jgi:hypothetical protein